MRFMPEVIGNTLHKLYVLDTYGQETLDHILNAMPEETRTTLEKPSLSGSWYPVEVLQDFLKVFDTILGRDRLKQLAVHTIDNQIRGLYGFILSFLSPVVEGAQRMWSKFYSEGSVILNDFDGLHVSFDVVDFRFSDEQRFVFQHYIQALVEKLKNK